MGEHVRPVPLLCRTRHNSSSGVPAGSTCIAAVFSRSETTSPNAVPNIRPIRLFASRVETCQRPGREIYRPASPRRVSMTLEDGVRKGARAPANFNNVSEIGSWA
jgi:hypothetical protein